MWGLLVWELTPTIRHYPWGDTTTLPAALGVEPDGSSWAEAWWGAHPSAPAIAHGYPDAGEREHAASLPLDAVISADPAAFLGDGHSRLYGDRLPFLVKMIAVHTPLSLQVHPDYEQAARGYAAENAAGLDPSDPSRNYHDPFHKPEMVLALTPFEALSGFRTPNRALQILGGLDTSLTNRMHARLLAEPSAHGMRAVFEALVSPSTHPEAREIDQVAAACAQRLAGGASPSPRIDRTVVMLHEHFGADPGVVAALLLNPVSLRPGEAMFVPPGAIHSYLSGTAIEVMASSDNVLRVALTRKHVDPQQMLQCVSTTAAPPIRVAPETSPPGAHAAQNARIAHYYAPVDDFALLVAHADDQCDWLTLPGFGVRVLLCLNGTVHVQCDGRERTLAAGEAVIVSAAEGSVSIRGQGRVIQASAP